MTDELRRQMPLLIPRFAFSIGIVLDPEEIVSGDERFGRSLLPTA